VHLLNLASGSGGNATVVAHGGRAILIDAGISRRRTLAGLEGLALEGILITHVHGDHLGPAARKLGAPVWIDGENARAARRMGRLEGDAEVFDGGTFRVGPFLVSAIPLPHPGGERWRNWGFRVECGRRRLAYATDLGHVPPGVLEELSGAHAVFLESNHDPDLERASGRPPDLVDWVLSDHGHLSNEQCAEALGRLGRPHTVVLGHLSEDCNRPALARRTAAKALGSSVRLVVALQREPTPALPV